MKIAGIIAEYNPFHNGHAYHIRRTREQATHIAAVISGHFTQRGDLACLSKWTRTQAALENGVDLVLELPAVYACSSAERFALGGVSLLDSLGCVEILSFGSEAGDIQPLEDCARRSADIHKSEKMQNLLKQGLPYPKARQMALGESGTVLEQPNNTLGVEYIKAALKINAGFVFTTFKRAGAEHDSFETGDNIASASFLRSAGEWQSFVPPNAISIYRSAFGHENAKFSRLENMLLYLFRTCTKEQWKQLPDVTEGLENRLFEAAQKAITVDEFLNDVKTKRYTMSRLRRIICALLLGLNKEDYSELPRYGRILGMNKRGFEILSKAKELSSIQISSDFALLNRQFPQQTRFDKRATDIFYLATPKIVPARQDFYRKPVIIE